MSNTNEPTMEAPEAECGESLEKPPGKRSDRTFAEVLERLRSEGEPVSEADARLLRQGWEMRERVLSLEDGYADRLYKLVNEWEINAAFAEGAQYVRDVPGVGTVESWDDNGRRVMRQVPTRKYLVAHLPLSAGIEWFLREERVKSAEQRLAARERDAAAQMQTMDRQVLEARRDVERAKKERDDAVLAQRKAQERASETVRGARLLYDKLAEAKRLFEAVTRGVALPAWEEVFGAEEDKQP